VAIKVLSKPDDQDPDNELQRYIDNRRELNMIYDLNHSRIVKFYGVLTNPVAFVMEWAGHGSLDAIIKQYRSHKCYICPDSVLAIAYQVNIGYILHVFYVRYSLRWSVDYIIYMERT